MAGDPDVADLLAAGCVHQLRNRVIQRLGFDAIHVDADQVGALAWLDTADQVAKTQCARAAERCHAQCTGGIQRRGILRHALGKQRGSAQLAEHVEIVVARATVGAQREIDPGATQLFDFAKTRGQLEIRFRTMHDTDAAFGA